MTTESPAVSSALLLLEPLLDRALDHVDHLFLPRVPMEVVALAAAERDVDHDEPLAAVARAAPLGEHP